MLRRLSVVPTTTTSTTTTTTTTTTAATTTNATATALLLLAQKFDSETMNELLHERQVVARELAAPQYATTATTQEYKLHQC